MDDITVSCSVTDTAGVFTFTPDPINLTIAPGGTESVGFQCTPTTPEVFSAEVSCAIGGDVDTQTADFTVLCQGQPLVVPTMNRWGLMLLALMLLMVAGFAGRRTLSNRG
ncbi:MAG: IPTL-CTERM sorting domain-containing protein [Wenzhouxiangellaceae bacterium]